MEQRVEKLEEDVSTLNDGQQQILTKLDGQQQVLTKLSEMFERLISPSALQPELEVGETSRIPMPNLGGTRFSLLTPPARATTSQQSFTPRLVKLDFPRYNGEEDTTSWTCRAEQFFNFHQTPEEERVALASFHLEGDAQMWFQVFKQDQRMLDWRTFCDGLHSRFGPTPFQDFFGELAKLQQLGTVLDYQSQFEKLLSKVGHLPPHRQVSFFVSGLNNQVKVDVLASRPTTLSAAIGLARLYEARDQSLERKSIPPDIEPLPVRRISPTEMQERRAKGLCYNCNERFVPGHRCKKLFLLEGCYEEEDATWEETDARQHQLSELGLEDKTRN
ncbi:uncharacterized protein LOC122645127 [Telopea speciosissima]|uniref:uncharacterized protein LOC122645127 n=1 Tax=Telopea speciosissima TaxID=54955 RepID=UPI001CC4FA23|nr:uncharacterized protein LOC122645127 [Telopea speciosissima]